MINNYIIRHAVYFPSKKFSKLRKELRGKPTNLPLFFAMSESFSLDIHSLRSSDHGSVPPSPQRCLVFYEHDTSLLPEISQRYSVQEESIYVTAMATAIYHLSGSACVSLVLDNRCQGTSQDLYRVDVTVDKSMTALNLVQRVDACLKTKSTVGSDTSASNGLLAASGTKLVVGGSGDAPESLDTYKAMRTQVSLLITSKSEHRTLTVSGYPHCLHRDNPELAVLRSRYRRQW